MHYSSKCENKIYKASIRKQIYSCSLGQENFFLTKHTKSTNHRRKKKKTGKIKNSNSSRDLIQRVKRQAPEQKIFAQHVYDKGLQFRIHKELFQIQKKETDNLIEKWVKVLNKYFTKEDGLRANKFMKKCSASVIIKKIDLKLQ